MDVFAKHFSGLLIFQGAVLLNYQESEKILLSEFGAQTGKGRFEGLADFQGLPLHSLNRAQPEFEGRPEDSAGLLIQRVKVHLLRGFSQTEPALEANYSGVDRRWWCKVEAQTGKPMPLKDGVLQINSRHAHGIDAMREYAGELHACAERAEGLVVQGEYPQGGGCCPLDPVHKVLGALKTATLAQIESLAFFHHQNTASRAEGGFEIAARSKAERLPEKVINGCRGDCTPCELRADQLATGKCSRGSAVQKAGFAA